MKKALSLIVSAAIIISSVLSFSITAFAESVTSGRCGSGEFAVSWALDESGTITFSGSQRIPNYSESSRPDWYNYRTQIKRVVIESGIVQIGAYAFAECNNLEEVDFGSIDTLGNDAFYNCASLKHAVIPDSCQWMYYSAFENCTALQSVYMGAGWVSGGKIPSYFFKNCTSLSVIQLGSGFSGVDTQSLEGCSALAVVITNNSSFPSGSYAIKSTSALSGVCSENTNSSQKLTYNFDIKNSKLYFTGSGDMTRYENGSQPWKAFMGAVNYIDFSETDALTSVSGVAFQGCETVKKVNFENVYAIGDGAFAECTSLGDIEFDSVLNQIWYYAFANDTGIGSIVFHDGTEALRIYHNAFENCTGTTFWLNLPSNTYLLEEHAFYGTGFNYITCTSSSVEIGEDAFGKAAENQYARFFGNSESGIYNYVKSGRSKGYAWYYYCINDNHSYSVSTISPTCTEQGYDSYTCINCDYEEKTNFASALGHKYSYVDNSGITLNYSCSRCGSTGLTSNAYEALDLFSGAISQTADSTKFNQYNYNGKCDINNDGVINAKDFVFIKNLADSPDLTGKETTIDLSTQYQTIEGFGASAAWWSQYVGTWENAEEIISMLYSKENGIGLNIYRYNLGAGSEDQKDYHLYVEDARTHCFLQQDGTYNWNNDPGAMNSLSIANRLNPNLKVTLFCNSAPVWMTINGKSYGALNSTSNLDSSNYGAFANYVAACAEHFIDEGYNVTSVSPINEPEWDWFGWANGDNQDSNQEGCHWEYAAARDFYDDYMVSALENNSKLNGKVGIEIWESGQMNKSGTWNNFLNNCFSSQDKLIEGSSGDYNDGNRNIRRYVDTVATHSYWASTSDRRAVANQLKGKNFGQKIRSTEYCQMTNDANSGVLGHIQSEGGNTNGMTIDYGLALADIIYQDMTIINAVEWDWWTACGKGVYPDSLIYVNAGNHDHIETSKRLWALGNYSKFIEEGAKRVSVSTGSNFASNLTTQMTYNWADDWGNSGTDKNNYLEESAYLNPDGSVVVVYINNSDTTEYTTFDSSVYSSFTSYVTDSDRDLAKYQSGKADKAVCIPKKSITTVVLNQGKTPAKSTEGAYLFTYFTGNSQSEQKIRFAVSEDGYNFSPLNGNNAVITQKLGTQNCRDPYIFKGEDDYYYLIATDMDASNNVWWGNSDSMVIWRSQDLVNWSDETIISMTDITGADDIQRCWAPQVIWDSKEQKYLVYFGLASWSVTQNLTEMYYCYTDDLMNQSHYSYPKLLYKPSDNGAAIDGDIIYDSKTKTYYLYYKDETNATICFVTSKNLTGPYNDASNPVKVIKSDVGLEGCNAHFITGTNTLVMLADAYGDGYFVLNQSTDFKNFYTLDSTNYTINNCSPRHGSVIAISKEQYNSLVTAYGL